MAAADKVHRMELRVRYAEVDRLGQVHSSRYAVYLEMGRTEMLRASGMTYRDLEAEGVYLVVTKLRLSFRRPARYDDLLTMETRVSRATVARIDHAYRLVRGEELLAEGETTLACVSRDGQVQRMPESLLRLLGVR
jgi:acyl-CoA thioester hydrolase